MSPPSTGKMRQIERSLIDWQGVVIEILYEENWMQMNGSDIDLWVAHLEVRAIKPERAPLPITETGYKSHFLHLYEIEECGSPDTYVRNWLDDAARSERWLSRQETCKQLSLF